MPTDQPESSLPDAVVELAEGARVRCAGAWTVHGIARLEARLAALRWPQGGEVVIDAAGVSAMDTAGAWLLQRAVQRLESSGGKVVLQGLRAEHAALMEMVRARAAEVAAVPTPAAPGLLERTGMATWEHALQVTGMLAFIGEAAAVALRSLLHPSRMRWRPVLHNLHSAGFNALPIVGLLSFLMGTVIAYQGAEQLRRYGANIFIADLVGLSMLRELAPLLTAIIVAGRSGSAYAAQIGTMKVTEEIDALRTIGIVPTELLVLPKIMAMMIALPLLTVYADMMSVFGGMVMARAQLGVSFEDFIDRFGDAVRLSSYLTGIGKAPVFAAIIAVVGCFQGFRVQGGADSVGRQTTVSVVQSIFLVILADAIFSVVFSNLHI
jgi:phospholipid/cholesterol/gamma-HCH transport system permease protein